MTLPVPGGVGGGERPHISSSRSNSLRRVVASFRRLLLLCGFHSITRQIQLQDHAVMDQAIDRRRRRHRIFEDSLPLAENKIAREQHASSLVTVRQEREEHIHLFTALLHVADVVDNQRFVLVEPLQFLLQLQIMFGLQQLLHQQYAGREINASALLDQFVAQRAAYVCRPAARISEDQNVLCPSEKLSVQQRRELTLDISLQATSLEGFQRLLSWQPRRLQPLTLPRFPFVDLHLAQPQQVLIATPAFTRGQCALRRMLCGEGRQLQSPGSEGVGFCPLAKRTPSTDASAK